MIQESRRLVRAGITQTQNSPESREGEIGVVLAGVTPVISVLERRAIGAVAQW